MDVREWFCLFALLLRAEGWKAFRAVILLPLGLNYIIYFPWIASYLQYLQKFQSLTPLISYPPFYGVFGLLLNKCGPFWTKDLQTFAQ